MTAADEKECIIYSIGGNNKWEFERDAVRKTPCLVHTLDCTGEATRFQKPPNERIHFHHVCLGNEFEASPAQCKGRAKCGETWSYEMLQQRLGHKRVDLFKMDIEGYEFNIFDNWKKLSASATMADQVLIPMQVLVEIHYRTPFPVLRTPNPELTLPQEFKTPTDIVMLQKDLPEMGYIVVKRDDNGACHASTAQSLRW